ncbi:MULTISPECIES: hypothetical protein [unclassified Sporosarcina]|uniref:hypothetical protein n=1 Tax=unclassified Sporosarcina TaxID=2647733 RepID=UPI0013042318|nr:MULTISPECIES: hypothetical protein [unclassified Sporosarcina]
MAKDDRKEIMKTNEMRTREISEMIGEGGMGADKYYDIKKVPPAEKVIEVPEGKSTKNN